MWIRDAPCWYSQSCAHCPLQQQTESKLEGHFRCFCLFEGVTLPTKNTTYPHIGPRNPLGYWNNEKRKSCSKFCSIIALFAQCCFPFQIVLENKQQYPETRHNIFPFMEHYFNVMKYYYLDCVWDHIYQSLISDAAFLNISASLNSTDVQLHQLHSTDAKGMASNLHITGNEEQAERKPSPSDHWHPAYTRGC